MALLAADTAYGLSLLGGGWDAGGPVDATWIVFYVGVGLAALHPSMVLLSEPSPPNSRLTRTRLALLAGASLMAPAVLVVQTLRDEPIDVGVIAEASVVLFLLALAAWAVWPARWPCRPSASGPCRRCCERPSRSGCGWPPTSTTGRSRS